MLLKTGSAYGAQVGNQIIFTREGAINRYKTFLDLVYNRNGLDMAGSVVLGEVENDLIKIGFTPEELEQIEIDFLESTK